jgi:hypothetical protein
MEDLIAETPADDIEGMGMKLALNVYVSSVDAETADSVAERVLSAYKDCVRVLGRDHLAEVNLGSFNLQHSFPRRVIAGFV